MERQQSEIATRPAAAPAVEARENKRPAFIAPDMERRKILAKLYAASSFLPAAWKKLPDMEKVADLVIIIGRAEALNCDPLLLLQNMTFIAGNVGWKSTFLLQLLQAHGWTAPQYTATGNPNAQDFWGKEDNGMTFSAVNPATGERETGTKITVKMVLGERWLDRDGSKWRTMPEQMFKYRAVAFFCRTNAPAVLGGFYSQDELEDIAAAERQVPAAPLPPPPPPPPAPIPAAAPTQQEIDEAWARSPLNPGGSYYHD